MHVLFEHLRLRRLLMLAALIALALAASAAMVMAAPADAPNAGPEPLRLRAHIAGEGPQLLYGDVFSNAGALAGKVLTRAPEPGRRVSLDPAWLAAKVRADGRFWANASGLKRVTVSRAGRRIGSGSLRALIATELGRRSDGTDYDIALANRAQELFVPAQDQARPKLLSLDFNESNGVFNARIRPYEKARAVLVRGRAWALVQAPVLVRPLKAGEKIAPEDIKWRPVRAARLRPDDLLDATALEGMAARRPVRANMPLRAKDFKRPATVKKGEIITLVYAVPGLRLTAQARALEDAALGAPVRVVNLKTSRTIQVVVTAPGMARAGPGAANPVAGG